MIGTDTEACSKPVHAGGRRRGQPDLSCDVLVAGSGIAGLSAAIEAARAGARVILASTGPLRSGSSFYAGTWGMGLVGPASDDADGEDFAGAICRVGCGMADPALVRTLVRGVRPAIAWLEDLGVRLREPSDEQASQEVGFIPCFDDRPRLWRGIEQEGLWSALTAELGRLGVGTLERCELVDLIEGDGEDGSLRVLGAWLYDQGQGRFLAVGCGAVVLATGGASGLFQRRLTSGDVLGTAQGIALAHGCGLVNVEFMQIMPGLVAPAYGVVFNEKTFRYLDTSCFVGTGLPTGDALAWLLEMRSGHGPFTSRLPDHVIDLAIDGAGSDGLAMRYRGFGQDVPEFVQIFSEWLGRTYGLTSSDGFRLGLFAHASNGGIRIGLDGGTALPGLYAAGEATGGMHGADRLGGLSSANGLVFGRLAGRAAAGFSLDAAGRTETLPTDAAPGCGIPCRGLAKEEAEGMTQRLAAVLSARCMVGRTEEGLGAALAEVEDMERALAEGVGAARQEDDAALARALRLRWQLLHARALISAMLARTESRGSHHRADHPAEDCRLSRPHEVVAQARDGTFNLEVRPLEFGSDD